MNGWNDHRLKKTTLTLNLNAGLFTPTSVCCSSPDQRNSDWKTHHHQPSLYISSFFLHCWFPFLFLFKNLVFFPVLEGLALSMNTDIDGKIFWSSCCCIKGHYFRYKWPWTSVKLHERTSHGTVLYILKNIRPPNTGSMLWAVSM